MHTINVCVAAYAFELHQCGTLVHAAAHYHIKDPLFWRLADKALSTKRLLYRVSSLLSMLICFRNIVDTRTAESEELSNARGV